MSNEVNWGKSIKYDKGYDPAISINNEGVVVEIHSSESGNDIYNWYHVGSINTDTDEIIWGSSHKISDGSRASIAINNQRAVVEVHDHPKDHPDHLMYHAGTVDAENQTISWGSHIKYDKGYGPVVALNDSGVVVEMHMTSGDDMRLWYHVGKLNGQTIDWGSSHKHDCGYYVSIALNNNGVAVEVHTSEKERTLFYRVGTVDINKKTIDWGDSHKYDTGIRPAIGLNDDGVVVEVHESPDEDKIWNPFETKEATFWDPFETNDGQMWYHVGRVDAGSKKISFGSSKKYDKGTIPKADINGSGIVVEAHESQNEGTVWYHMGKLAE